MAKFESKPLFKGRIGFQANYFSNLYHTFWRGHVSNLPQELKMTYKSKDSPSNDSLKCCRKAVVNDAFSLNHY